MLQLDMTTTCSKKSTLSDCLRWQCIKWGPLKNSSKENENASIGTVCFTISHIIRIRYMEIRTWFEQTCWTVRMLRMMMLQGKVRENSSLRNRSTVLPVSILQRNSFREQAWKSTCTYRSNEFRWHASKWKCSMRTPFTSSQLEGFQSEKILNKGSPRRALQPRMLPNLPTTLFQRVEKNALDNKSLITLHLTMLNTRTLHNMLQMEPFRSTWQLCKWKCVQWECPQGHTGQITYFWYECWKLNMIQMTSETAQIERIT